MSRRILFSWKSLLYEYSWNRRSKRISNIRVKFKMRFVLYKRSTGQIITVLLKKINLDKLIFNLNYLFNIFKMIKLIWFRCRLHLLQIWVVYVFILMFNVVVHLGIWITKSFRNIRSGFFFLDHVVARLNLVHILNFRFYLFS